MKVLVFGGSGYVGSLLCPKLAMRGHEVANYDILNGDDIRDIAKVSEAVKGQDAVIHLACLSNDPTADLNPAVTKAINYDSFRPVVKACKHAGVRRFIFASTSAVYGVREEKNVTENLACHPITDYARYKLMCEEVLHEERQEGFESVIVRPATVCGYAPALRLDLCVHILTMAALRKGVITVFGGDQYRPNIHIQDITDAYISLLTAKKEQIDGKIYNIGAQNLTIKEIAQTVAGIIPTEIKYESMGADNRSYHVSAGKFCQAFNWEPKYTIENAIIGIMSKYRYGEIPDPDDEKYYRVRQMKQVFAKEGL